MLFEVSIIFKRLISIKCDLSISYLENYFLLFSTKSFEAAIDDVIGMSHRLKPRKR